MNPMHRLERQGRLCLRHGLLAGAAAAAFGLATPALAQGQAAQSAPSQAPSQQPGSNLPPVVGQIRTSEQALRQSQNELTGSGQPNFAQARTAVESGLNVIGRVPQGMQGQEVWRTAERELSQAKEALSGGQPNAQQAATQMREAANALGSLAGRMASSADAGGGQGRANAQASRTQVAVQQPAPQITVQQPAPQVTILQPPPQVTIQQPEPRVTVRQAEPQVRVQQAEPQVNVQSQGQPQVTVQRQGAAQVAMQGQNSGQQDRRATRNVEQASGTSSGPAAPAQSGGSGPQQVAASPAAGISLQSVQSLVGTNVVGANGREAGEVRNLLIDDSGRVRAAVVEWGGFLGIGERQAVVPIERIELGQGNERAELTMTREELEALPRYERDRIAEYGRERGWGEGLRLFR